MFGCLIWNFLVVSYHEYKYFFRVKHVMVTSFLLVLGAMSMTWICDTISESGFGTFSTNIAPSCSYLWQCQCTYLMPLRSVICLHRFPNWGCILSLIVNFVASSTKIPHFSKQLFNWIIIFIFRFMYASSKQEEDIIKL